MARPLHPQRDWTRARRIVAVSGFKFRSAKRDARVGKLARNASLRERRLQSLLLDDLGVLQQRNTAAVGRFPFKVMVLPQYSAD